MPIWFVVALIAAAWAVVVAGIVVFMMGASRVRRKQREQDMAAQFHLDKTP